MGLIFSTSKYSYLSFSFWGLVKVYFIVYQYFIFSCSLFSSMQPEIPFLPVFSSMKRLVRYNLGSVALGSLIVSFVESIRFMLESIRRRLKVAGTTPDNWFGKAVYHTLRFSLRCIEWTIKSANRNAYIMVIFYISSKCSSFRKIVCFFSYSFIFVWQMYKRGTYLLGESQMPQSISSLTIMLELVTTWEIYAWIQIG